MSAKAIRAKQKANRYLEIIELVLDGYDHDLTELAQGTDIENVNENPFFQVSMMIQEKYGDGACLALNLLKAALLTILYFKGHMENDDYEDTRQAMIDLVEKLAVMTDTKVTMH